jgi:hypothetical protein
MQIKALNLVTIKRKLVAKVLNSSNCIDLNMEVDSDNMEPILNKPLKVLPPLITIALPRVKPQARNRVAMVTLVVIQ